MFLLRNANCNILPPLWYGDSLRVVPRRLPRARGRFSPLGGSFAGPLGSFIYAIGIFRDGSGAFHCRFTCLGRSACDFSACQKVLAVMRNFFADDRAGGTYGEADGCIDTSAGISNHASLFFLSFANNPCDRNLLPPASIEGQRDRSGLARFIKLNVVELTESLSVFSRGLYLLRRLRAQEGSGHYA